MKKTIKGLVLGIIITTILMGTAIGATIKKTIEVTYNSVHLTVNGKKIVADNILYEGTTYVPIRSVAEALGKEVGWVQETKTASINDKTTTNKPKIEDTGNKNIVIEYKVVDYRFIPTEYKTGHTFNVRMGDTVELKAIDGPYEPDNKGNVDGLYKCLSYGSLDRLEGRGRNYRVVNDTMEGKIDLWAMGDDTFTYYFKPIKDINEERLKEINYIEVTLPHLKANFSKYIGDHVEIKRLYGDYCEITGQVMGFSSKGYDITGRYGYFNTNKTNQMKSEYLKGNYSTIRGQVQKNGTTEDYYIVLHDIINVK